MKVLFDGDVLIYMAGFALERRHYEVEHEGKTLQFKGKRDANKYIKDKKGAEIYMVRESKGLDSSIICLNNIIHSTLDRMGTDKYKIYLSPENKAENFRYEVDQEYKANRKDSVKPIFIKELTEHLRNHWNAERTIGQEADDALGISQGQDTIIASIDKDLLMIPGKHYNLKRQTVYESSDPGELFLMEYEGKKPRLEGFGFKWFCAQMLLGDPIDNIKGIDRYGPKTVHKLLKKSKDNKESWEIVKKIYKEKKRDYLTNAKLLWILRERDTHFDEALI